MAPSPPQLGFLPLSSCRGGNGSPGRYIENGVLGETWQTLSPPAQCSQMKPGPKCFRVHVTGCQSCCTRRLARHKGTQEGPLITPAALRAHTRSIYILMTPCFGPRTLPHSPPTTSPAGNELIRCPTFPSGHFAAQHGKVPAGCFPHLCQ